MGRNPFNLLVYLHAPGRQSRFRGVTQRGNRRENVFFTDEDRAIYLGRLEERGRNPFKQGRKK